MRKIVRFVVILVAVVLVGLLLIAANRWFAIAAIQDCLQRDWEIQINGGKPRALPDSLDGGVSWILDRAFADSVGKDNRNEVIHERFTGLFQGRIHALEIYNPYVFDEKLGKSIGRLGELESLMVVEPEDLYPIPKSAVTKLLESIRRLPKLKTLEIGTTWLHDDDLAILRGHPKLEILLLNGCPITTKSFDTLVSLPQLKEVQLYNTKISVKETQRLAQLLPNLRIIGAAEPPIGPPEIETRLEEYATLLSEWQKKGLAAHFPQTLPALAGETKLSAFDYLDRAWLQIRLTLPTAEVASIFEEASRQAKAFYDGGYSFVLVDTREDGLPGAEFHTGDTQSRDFPDDYRTFIYQAKADRAGEPLEWQHGESCGIIVSRMRNEIIYFAEAW
jgi:hypothetical protein